jgi:hypothetical protein
MCRTTQRFVPQDSTESEVRKGGKYGNDEKERRRKRDTEGKQEIEKDR